MNRISIYGIEIMNLNFEEVSSILENHLRNGNHLMTIATPNTEIAMKARNEKKYADLINKFDLVVPDGIGLIYASKVKKHPLKERVTGFDISTFLLELGKKFDINLYILAGKEGISDMARENIERDYEGIKVVGNRNGYFDESEESKIVEEINEKNPDVIFAGLGFPKQEKFIDRNRDKINAKIIIGNGGVTDIFAGVSNRAPDIFIKLNLEWFYRLLKEPKRIKRQMAIPKFMISVIMDREAVKEVNK